MPRLFLKSSFPKKSVSGPRGPGSHGQSHWAWDPGLIWPGNGCGPWFVYFLSASFSTEEVLRLGWGAHRLQHRPHGHECRRGWRSGLQSAWFSAHLPLHRGHKGLHRIYRQKRRILDFSNFYLESSWGHPNRPKMMPQGPLGLSSIENFILGAFIFSYFLSRSTLWPKTVWPWSIHGQAKPWPYHLP